PGVDLDQIRHANFCGLGQRVERCTTLEGKPLRLTGHRGASASHLQQAIDIMGETAAPYGGIVSHLVPYRDAPSILARLATPEADEIAGAPAIKVIIDFSDETSEIVVF